MIDSVTKTQVDQALEQIGAGFTDAWRRMERGENVHEKHVSFVDWETMVRVLSSKRLELLR